ncbi:ABC transporter permease [Streptomyces sp. NPDC050504]|uniref:ABC transporter permease n=1 Tax=Streptomyces sp. NPDC050504 TaxID=3365618 RepID=UPI00378F2833
MFLPNGLARAAVRFKPSAFVGTFVALFLTSTIVAACGILLETGIRATAPAGRYAAAPVVAAADQQAHYTTGSGEDRTEMSVPYGDKARLDSAVVAKAAAVEGAARAVPDIAFPITLVSRGGAPLTAHNWASTAFTGERAQHGTPPRTGEIALPAATGAKTGDRVRVDTPTGVRTLRVAALTGSDAAHFADADAARVSGHPRQIDAVAVLPEPGTGAKTLADRVEKALKGTGAKVYEGKDRGTVGEPALASAKELLTGIGGSFGGIAAMVAVFTAAGTVALSVGQRAREFALLRAIGATPRQLRRSIATEALLVAPLAGALGSLPGIALATWWFGQLRDKGAIPGTVDLTVSALPPLAATAAAVLTALLAGFCAARRPARTKPGQALAESAVERRTTGWVRTGFGVAALVGGTVFAGVAAQETGEDAANAALGVVMLYMLAVALLGPLIARLCAGLFGLPLRGGGASASLAAANSRSNSRRLASAITPIVLAMAFSSTLVFMHSSEERARENQQREGITADRVVTGALTSDATARAADTPGVTAAVGLLRTSVVAPSISVGERGLQTRSAQGFTGTAADLARVQDLGVGKGSLTALTPGSRTVAIGDNLADAARVSVGDRIELHLPDGTEAAPRVVAVYSRSLGLAEVTLPAADLAAHVTDPRPTEVLVRADEPEALEALAGPGVTVTTPAGHAAAEDTQREVGAWANTVMAAVLGGFAAVAAANTLVMTVLDRRRELAMLRLVGSTRRQVLRMVRWEALLVAAAGILIGTGIAMATLVPMMKGLTGEAPYVPPVLYGSFAAAVVLLGLAATALPARAALRAPRG